MKFAPTHLSRSNHRLSLWLISDLLLGYLVEPWRTSSVSDLSSRKQKGIKQTSREFSSLLWMNLSVHLFWGTKNFLSANRVLKLCRKLPEWMKTSPNYFLNNWNNSYTPTNASIGSIHREWMIYGSVVMLIFEYPETWYSFISLSCVDSKNCKRLISSVLLSFINL